MIVSPCLVKRLIFSIHLISNGHYCIPLTPKQLAVTDIQQNGSPPVEVLFTVDDLQKNSTQEKAAMTSKLHKQFGHTVNSERLKQLLRDASIRDDIFSSK